MKTGPNLFNQILFTTRSREIKKRERDESVLKVDLLVEFLLTSYIYISRLRYD